MLWGHSMGLGWILSEMNSDASMALEWLFNEPDPRACLEAQLEGMEPFKGSLLFLKGPVHFRQKIANSGVIVLTTAPRS